MNQLWHEALWVTVGASFVREALHLALPADGTLGFGLELFLAVVPVAYIYQSRQSSENSTLVSLAVALLYALGAVGLQQLVFPLAEARFWLTPPLVFASVAVVWSAMFTLNGIWPN